jgi:hypothetical protein
MEGSAVRLILIVSLEICCTLALDCTISDPDFGVASLNSSNIDQIPPHSLPVSEGLSTLLAALRRGCRGVGGERSILERAILHRKKIMESKLLYNLSFFSLSMRVESFSQLTFSTSRPPLGPHPTLIGGSVRGSRWPIRRSSPARLATRHVS